MMRACAMIFSKAVFDSFHMFFKKKNLGLKKLSHGEASWKISEIGWINVKREG